VVLRIELENWGIPLGNEGLFNLKAATTRCSITKSNTMQDQKAHNQNSPMTNH